MIARQDVGVAFLGFFKVSGTWAGEEFKGETEVKIEPTTVFNYDLVEGGRIGVDGAGTRTTSRSAGKSSSGQRKDKANDQTT